MTSKVWIRLLCLILCLTVLLPCVSALAETTKVSAYLLRLRKSPSKNAAVLDAYPRGTVVTILKKGDTWTKVSVRGKVGYMMTSMLAYSKKKVTATKVTTAKSSTTTSTTVSSGSTAYIIKGARVNLRAEASDQSDILDSYRGGTAVTVIKKGKIWTLVEVKGKRGYIYTEFLTTEKGK